MSFIFPAAVYQPLPQFYLTSTATFSNPFLLKRQEALRGLNFDFEADILNFISDHLFLKIHLIAHIEQHGHRKPLFHLETSQQMSETYR